MDRETARALNELNAVFYRTHAASFSATRRAPWRGWERLLNLPEVRALLGNGAPLPLRGADANAAPADPLVVLDVACGNLRFENFLAERAAGRPLHIYAVDNCPDLAGHAPALGGAPRQLCRLSFQNRDIVQALIEGQATPALELPPAHLAVSFGFMHHVPGAGAREDFLAALLGCLRPGGIAAVSLWRFMDDPRLAAKARAITAPYADAHGLALEKNDYLLGWQDSAHTVRYCHHFCEEEIARLADATSARASAQLVNRFEADGKGGRLNTYLVFKCPAQRTTVCKTAPASA